MVVMIGSGWEIYNASPLFAFTFPRAITLGGWLAGALLWHFAAMWVLAVNGLSIWLWASQPGGSGASSFRSAPARFLADAKSSAHGQALPRRPFRL